MAVTKQTLPGLFYDKYTSMPKKTALREKDFGIWQEFTWKDYGRVVAVMGLYFKSLGLKKGDTIAIIGDNKPEWIISEIAAQFLGAVPIGIYQDSVVEEVKYLLERSDAKIVVTEDQEQVDKVLDIAGELPALTKVIYYDDRGMYQYDDDILVSFTDVVAKAKINDAEVDSFLDEHARWRRPDEVAIMCTTSGTTGKPKLAMLTHENLIFMADSLAKADPKFSTDDFVSFLPLPWIGEQMMSVSSALLFGFAVNFPESTDTVQADMKEVGPHFVFSPPRVWENIASSVQVQVMDASRIKKKVFEACLPIGYAWAEHAFDKKTPSFMMRLKYRFAYYLVFRKLKERLGFSKLRSGITGGAALGPDTFKFFHALGVNLKQIYGQTEIAGISCIHRADDIDFTSVGKPIDGTELKITEDGEIVSKSKAVFKGYYADEQATADTLKDGWLYSGDAGYFDESGKLVVIDRMKDLMYLNDGTRFSPLFIENKLKFSPYVKEAVILGNNRDTITAIINIDMGIVGKWAENNRLAYTTYTDLSAKPEVYGLIAAEVQAVNDQLPPEHRVKKFVLLYKELDADDGELTRTRKVRRGFIDEKYKTIVEALYTDASSVHIDAEITLQDGRVRTISTDLAIHPMEA